MFENDAPPARGQKDRSWIKRYIFFHGVRHPAEMGAVEINAFLTHWAVAGHVSASTQHQAFSALLVLYQQVLQADPGRLTGVVRAHRPKRRPVVLTRGEVQAVFACLEGVPLLVARLLYGAGLRLFEGVSLRVKDVDFLRGEVLVRDGKGQKDRLTMLPAAVRTPLEDHRTRVRQQHERDLGRGLGRAPRPDALARQDPRADREWGGQGSSPRPPRTPLGRRGGATATPSTRA